MKMINKFLLSFTLLFSTSVVMGAVSSSDNEISLEQTGDTLTLTIDQIGYGNKLCGTLNSNVCASDWTIAGTTLTINIDQIGNNNKVIGNIDLDTSDIDLTFTGDSNSWTWDIGESGSSDDSDLLVDFTGSSNTVDFKQGYSAAAERLDFDFDVIGDSNVFDIDINADDMTWDVDITGDSNNVVTTISDGSDHELKLDHTGDGGDIDIVMSSGTCPQGVNSCYSTIDLDITSDNATITINQKDTGD